MTEQVIEVVELEDGEIDVVAGGSTNLSAF